MTDFTKQITAIASDLCDLLDCSGLQITSEDRETVGVHLNEAIGKLLAAREQHGAFRDALQRCVSAIDGLLGDSELPEDDRPGVLAMRAARELLDAATLSPSVQPTPTQEKP